MSDPLDAPVKFDEVRANIEKYVKILSKAMKPDGKSMTHKVTAYRKALQKAGAGAAAQARLVAGQAGQQE